MMLKSNITARDIRIRNPADDGHTERALSGRHNRTRIHRGPDRMGKALGTKSIVSIGRPMKLEYISELNYKKVVHSYNRRSEVSRRLIALLHANREREYVDLALGIDDDGYGNFSASDHALGPRILSGRSYSTIFALAKRIANIDDKDELLKTIYAENIPYLKVSVGTEIAMLLRPETHWVANARSIWSHLLVKHRSIRLANEELSYYRAGAEDSKMAYRMWSAIHSEMASNVLKLAGAGTDAATLQGIDAGQTGFLWADAIANQLYEKYVDGQ